MKNFYYMTTKFKRKIIKQTCLKKSIQVTCLSYQKKIIKLLYVQRFKFQYFSQTSRVNFYK